MFNKKLAMTYAEMVLVLGLIGVIASITVPGLKKYSQRTEYGRLAQKAYLTLDQAIDSSTLANGEPNRWNFTRESFFSDYINPYIKKKAGDQTLTADGMRFSLDGCTETVCGIRVDINGDDPPNMVNRDIFTFNLEKMDVTNPNFVNVNRDITVRVVPTGIAACLNLHKWNYTQEIWDNYSSSGCPAVQE